METTIYLIRHSVRFNNDDIASYNTKQEYLLRNEKVILSVEGEKRAEILSTEKELQNLDAVYTSNCVRTLQTAKYILEKQHLKVNIDERFDEKRIADPNVSTVDDWFVRQYFDEDYKVEGGESQREVKKRFGEAVDEILDKYKGKRIAIFSHGYAITFFILNWCKFEYIPSTDFMKYTFRDKCIFNKRINAPEVFKLTFDDNNEIIDIDNIEFDDLPYRDGLGKKEQEIVHII